MTIPRTQSYSPIRDSPFDLRPEFDRFTNWLSGYGENFTVSTSRQGNLLRFTDRGNEASVGWIAGAVVTIGMAFYLPIMARDAHSRQSYDFGGMSVFLLVAGVIATYRASRSLARSSWVQIDLENARLEWNESWPTRRHFDIPLSSSHWIIQPLQIYSSGNPTWKGYLLRIAVKNDSFAVAAWKDPLQVRSAIPPELRGQIDVQFVREIALARLPM